MRIMLLRFSFVIVVLAIFGCIREPQLTEKRHLMPRLPSVEADYRSVHFPDHIKGHPAAKQLARAFGVQDDRFDDIRIDSPFGFSDSDKDIPEISNGGATLGRVLFYDRSLSLSNAISCGSCHFQDHAFADPRRFSPGFEGRTTGRNSMGILNAGLNEHMFWDSRTPTVKKLVLRPVQDHIEMGMESLDFLAEKLAGRSYYAPLFEGAYGSAQITEERIADALTQFLCSITSFDSKFDRNAPIEFSGYTAQEKLGKDLFFSSRTQCGSCHSSPNFAAPDFPGGSYGGVAVAGAANIGLDLHYADPGKSNGKFRIPSLRNIELTAPYMHDGRFDSLLEVIEHYDHGIKSHPHLDAKLKDRSGLPQRLNLIEVEKHALVAFLHTLTDESLIQDEKFSDPFDY